MPHTTVEYSGTLVEALDRPAFGAALHEALVTVAGGRAGGCKTRFVRHDDLFIGDGSAHHAMIHVEIALLSGRTPEVKRALTEAVLAALREHTAPTPQYAVQFSVDLRDLDRDAYVVHENPRTAS
ncbi:5-carboxymethyl-2-hydroxymuconate Delta-isomerase [Streptomyces cocklensis]|jgi:5-carboxymethyl-2-hydroxymuconate isomerase|uniref:5-carboxymethyl-2-hydroxymuconate isomerase n=1 Tax=Actinacidiphila cocklensis TaxID=887465 RepID=A0A9W4GSN2_9ACTN|nr:5-carboxymethyl-2-hydroxymuconate Delta-isomerase [Actinacidiphila cocklensis]MDD1062266.1 5-carboxymethyl-2-hydroxymuconate Delta-isomerase [Actinacidiphila cocklensis]WSX74156.1 5-carboxymethyl-2-hydroxymuconate Delta-isomerase [Streptomyces sp. NBC_00899]WSX79780.1 5-carboxymethyl-2-hydroxymuconate Delta-isomerase [Streptomyces sp. NBC_00899]CAG6395481.1 5-carboxymethyl-2-hydroxymuconate isomerase [Actinacidiphila cocklensis]